jgi:glycerol-3-phosphate dehydrogenase
MTMSPQETGPAPASGRGAALRAFTSETLDLLVIGGGIVGAGVARDAAMRGLRVGLAEQHDFAFGTSSRSSRLLHGGLRYLAQGRLGLVREASVEKRLLHHIAPHLAEPLPFLFPAFRGTDWPLWQLRIGVKLYDLLCGGKNLGKSSALSPSEVLARVPNLASERLSGGVRYFDAFTNDARLVIDTLRSAAKHGAVMANYLRFQTANPEPGQWVCELEDRVTLKKLTVQARTIVNATGPWAQGVPHSQVKLRLTKGIHIVVEREQLPVPEAVAITQGPRLLFLIPWGERVIVGTTDTDYRGSLDDVRAEQKDVGYLLGAVKEFFPSVTISASELVNTWAGLRPLIAEPEAVHTRRAHSPSEVARSHQIKNPEPGWWDVAGGKLTTYRRMGEQTVDQVVRWLKKHQVHGEIAEHCRTGEEPLLLPSETNGLSGILPPPFDRAVVEHFCRQEWALHLEDVMLRRTGWHHYFRDARSKAERVAEWMAQFAGWTEAQRKEELQNYANQFCTPTAAE